MDSQSVPKLTIVAGPNGSGKSTLTRYIRSNLDAPIMVNYARPCRTASIFPK